MRFAPAIFIALALTAPALARDSLGMFETWGAFRDPANSPGGPRCYAIAKAEHAERTNRNKMYTHILTDDEAIFAEPAELDPEATRYKLERNEILLKTTLGKQDNYATEGITLRLITRRYNVVMRGKVESNTRFENIQKATTVAGPTTTLKGTQYNSESIASSGKQFKTQLEATEEVFGRIASPMHQAKLEALIDRMTIAQDRKSVV